MKTKFFLLLPFLLLLNVVYAQQKVIGAAGFMRIGYAGAPGSASTFTKIAPQGISGFTNNYITLGGEAYFRFNKVVLGGEGSVSAQGVYSSADRYAEPFIAGGHFRFGWVITGEERYWVYPTIGLGTSALVLTTYNKVNGDEEAENLHNKILVSPSLDLGINSDFVINRVNKEKRGYGGFIVGIRAGYRMSYSHNDWRNEEWEELDNMPSYQSNVFYVTVAIGGGWFVKRNHAAQ